MTLLHPATSHNRLRILRWMVEGKGSTSKLEIKTMKSFHWAEDPRLLSIEAAEDLSPSAALQRRYNELNCCCADNQQPSV